MPVAFSAPDPRLHPCLVPCHDFWWCRAHIGYEPPLAVIRSGLLGSVAAAQLYTACCRMHAAAPGWQTTVAAVHYRHFKVLLSTLNMIFGDKLMQHVRMDALHD